MTVSDVTPENTDATKAASDIDPMTTFVARFIEKNDEGVRTLDALLHQISVAESEFGRLIREAHKMAGKVAWDTRDLILFRDEDVPAPETMPSLADLLGRMEKATDHQRNLERTRDALAHLRGSF